VEEQEYRRTYNSVSQRPCLFEKSVLAQRCGCRHARRFCLADREGVACGSETGNHRCRELLETLRTNARFALQMTGIHGPLPHAKELKVQSGGVRGLRAVLNSEHDGREPVEDVAWLTEQALERFGALENLPFEQIVQHILRFEGRRRRDRSRRKPDP
jgi:hypothetical protein